jgi:hypothetical protein
MSSRNARAQMDDSARIASLEADMQNTRVDIGEIKAAQSAQSATMGRIESRLSSVGTPNWQAMSVTIVVIGMIGSAAFYVFDQRARGNEARAYQLELSSAAAAIDRMQIRMDAKDHARDLYDKISARVNKLDRDAAKAESELRLKTAEIETQFGWLGDALNQDRAHRIRMEGLLYEACFGKPLPILHVNPIGPRRTHSGGSDN